MAPSEVTSVKQFLRKKSFLMKIFEGLLFYTYVEIHQVRRLVFVQCL